MTNQNTATCAPRQARASLWRPGMASLTVSLFGPKPARWLGPILYSYLRPLLGLLGLGLVAAGLGLVPPYLSKLVIDRGLMAGDVSALIGFSAALFAVGLAAVGLGAINNLLHMRVSVRMLTDLRAALLSALFARPGVWFSDQRAGELLARVDGDAGEVQKFAFNVVLGGLSALVRLIGGATMLMVLNWKLGLITAALAPIELLFLIWARPRTTRLAATVRSARGELTAGLAESLHNIPSLQIARGADWARSRSINDQDRLNQRLLGQQRWLELTRAVPQILSAIMRAVIFVIGGIMVIRGDWPLGSLIAFIAYVGFMIGPMQSLLGLWHAQARAKVALARLDGVMADGPAPVTQIAPRHPAHLELRHLQQMRTEERINLNLPESNKLALIGPSGSGKTSLLRLIAGQDDPKTEAVRLGGQPPAAQLDRIAFVPQRPLILRASLRDNLLLPACYWDDPKADTRVWAMLDTLGLGDRFRDAPGSGLDTLLGEQGLTLSGGERQRLCLARALLRPFDLLILDEALSEVDSTRVTQIMQFIDEEFSQATRIVTAHGDLSAYGPFDQVLDLGQKPL